MFTTYEKTFINNATAPVLVYVTAIVEDASGKITDIVRSGGSVPKHKSPNDAVTAEANRMHDWVRSTFIGQYFACFTSHNGVVPAPYAFRTTSDGLQRMFFASGDADYLGLNQGDRRFNIVNTVNIDGGDERCKIRMPAAMGEPYGAQDDTEQQAVQLEASAGYYQQFLNSVDSSGVNELPPREGERYFSVVSGNVYRVIDTTRKPYSRDYYVTMERESDKHRTKFTFRNHAVWLAVWRPVDDNGEAREVVQVEVESKREPGVVKRYTYDKTVEDCKARFDNVQGFNGVPFTPVTLNLRVNAQAASEVMQKIGEAAHEAAAQLAKYMREVDEDGVLDDLVRVYDELHRRVPGWNNKSLHEPGRTEADLAVRAIRKMARDLNTARKNFDAVQAFKDDLLRQKDELLKARESDKSARIEERRDIYVQGIRKVVSVVGIAEARATVARLFGRAIPLSGLSEKQLASLFEALIQEISRASL